MPTFQLRTLAFLSSGSDFMYRLGCIHGALSGFVLLPVACKPLWGQSGLVVDCVACASASQARVLMLCSLLFTYNTPGGGASGDDIMTDDVSLQVFMEHLQRSR